MKEEERQTHKRTDINQHKKNMLNVHKQLKTLKSTPRTNQRTAYSKTQANLQTKNTYADNNASRNG